MISFILNDKTINTDVSAGTVLLDFIRYHAHLSGTKIGCREGDCGACTVLIGELNDNNKIEYYTATSCLTPLGNIQHKHIVTIEGVNKKEGLTPVQELFCKHNGTQCGFCTPGFVMSATGYCLTDTLKNIDSATDAVAGNICRCTGYKSIERAMSELINDATSNTSEAINKEIVPPYFSEISSRLRALNNESSSNRTKIDSAQYNMGGGTDLYVQKHHELVEADMHFLTNDNELKGITFEVDTCTIGGACTVSDLLLSPIFKRVVPNFDEYADLISSLPIRNIATLAGNFVNASPIGDLSVLFLALDAKVKLTDSHTTRVVALKDFFIDYKKIEKTSEEIVEKIIINNPNGNSFINFEKVSKRRNLDIATVNTAIKLTIEDDKISVCNIAAGGVAPVPKYLHKASLFAIGREISVAFVMDLCKIIEMEVSPISDVRGSATYKKLLLVQLVKTHFITLFPHLSVKELLNAEP
jgi:xanthine dehydrogenase small subunit